MSEPHLCEPPSAPGGALVRADLRQALAVAAAVRERGGTVVTTNGCFDLIHCGHLDTLEGARALGDVLIVLLNSDASVRRLKGAGRPFIEAEDRCRLMSALRCVDQVALFDEDTPHRALELLRPHVHVKGGSFMADRLEAERQLVARWGGRLEVLPLRPGRSTTELLARLEPRGRP